MRRRNPGLKPHTGTHNKDGSDEIKLEDLGTDETNASFAFKPDGTGGVTVGSVAGGSSSFLNVQDYGAVGDGVTDDSTSIQNTIDAADASSTHKAVYFPPGTYLIGSTLDVTSSMRLFGNSESSILKAGNADENLIGIIGGGIGSEVEDVVVDHLSFDGSNLDTTNGIDAIYTKRAKVHDCYFKDFGNANNTGCVAIKFADYNWDTTVVNNFIEGGLGDDAAGDISVASHGGDTLISGNRCYSYNSQGISSTHNAKADRVIITGNISKNHTRHGIIAHYETETPVEDRCSTIVSNNIIIDCLSTGIYCRHGGSDGFLLEGNLIEYCAGAGANTGSLSGSISIWGSGKMTCRNNDLYYSGVQSDGTIRTQPPTWGPDDVVAIRVNNASAGVVLENNYIHYSTGDGIILYLATDHAVVRGNVIEDCWKSAITMGITVAAECIQIEDNTVRLSPTIPDMPGGETPHGIHVEYLVGTDHNIYIEGNKLYGNGITDGHGLGLTYPFEHGRINNNVIDGWDFGVWCFGTAACNNVGKDVTFNYNTIRNNATGYRSYLSPDNYVFGIENKFEGNALEQQISWFDGYRKSIARIPNEVFYDSSAPTTGTWAQGDKVINSTVTAGGIVEWECVSAGTPGTWEAQYLSSADRARANHTGTQTAATISDFDAEVSANSDVVLNNSHRAGDGTDHTYINQDVSTTALPSFAGVELDAQGSDPSVVEGRFWLDDDGNISYHSGAGRLNLNADRWAVCDNETGSTILAGKPVKVVGVASSGRRSIDLTDNTTLDNVERYFGIVMEDIGPGGTGKVAFKDGVAYNVDTSSWSNGSTLYLGSTPGALTDVRPSAPNYIASVGGVLFSHATTGIIAVQEGRSSLIDSKIKQNVSTGLIYGGELSINGTNPAQFDIAAGGAVIVDAYTDPSKPLLTSVEWDEQVGVTLTNLATQTQTVIAVDKDGVFQQLSTLATPSQSRDFASLGVLLHPSLTDIKSVSDGYKNLIHDAALRELDFSASIGTFIKETGLELSANGANLKFDRAAGLMYGQGINYFVSKKDPNRSVVDADSPVTFLLGKGTGFISGTPYTDVPTDKYDPSGAGTLADIPSGRFTAHRIYYGPSSKTTGLLYGQHIYDSLKKAIENVVLEEVVTSTPFTEAFVLGSIIVQQGATDLSDEFQAQFVTFGTFGDKTFPLAQETERFGEPVELLDGCSYEQQEITYLEDTGVIYADVERIGGGDITYIFGQQEFVLDCTTGTGVGGKARIALTAGASASDPIVNYIYVTRNGSGLVAQLNASTTRPTGEFAEVGRVYLQDITTFNAEKAYVAQRYTEAKAHKDRGAVAHIKEVLRVKGATWDDGVEPTGSIDTGQTPDVVDLSVASGYIYQLHRQSFPAMQVSVDGVYIANASGSGTYTKFQKVTTLGLLETAGGSSIGTNRRFNLVVWGVVNQTAGECKLFVNLPTDDYGDDSSAYADVNGTAVVSIPREFRGVGFLIARIPVKYTVVGGGTFEFINSGGQPAIIDLRGNPPGVSGSGASGAASSFSDASFSLFNELDSSKILDFDLSGLSTATTRTIAMPDADTTLLTQTEVTDLTDAGDSALHYHASDRDRANHTGTQARSTISDFDHASEHQDGGGDEIATATAAANAIPKATAGGVLADEWVSETSVTQHEGAIDHENILNNGANAHATIDSHIDDTSGNPHSVTKTQVSLGNVTDDAQLTRAADDFASFSSKAVPISGDLLLIEDSGAAGIKKYITVGDIAGSTEFADNEFLVYNDTDPSAKVSIRADLVSTSATRVVTIPDKSITLDDAADPRTPSSHAASHSDGGADEITVQDLGSGAAVATKVLETDGAGGWTLIDTPGAGFTPALAQTVYVDGSRGDSYTPDGTEAKPHLTITAALAAITDATASKRYTVFVKPGRYAESFSFKDYVSVIGQSRKECIIETSGTKIDMSDADHCTFSDFRIECLGAVAQIIEVDDGIDSVLRNLDIYATTTDFTFTGIYCIYSTAKNVYIDNVYINIEYTGVSSVFTANALQLVGTSLSAHVNNYHCNISMSSTVTLPTVSGVSFTNSVNYFLLQNSTITVDVPELDDTSTTRGVRGVHVSAGSSAYNIDIINTAIRLTGGGSGDDGRMTPLDINPAGGACVVRTSGCIFSSVPNAGSNVIGYAAALDAGVEWHSNGDSFEVDDILWDNPYGGGNGTALIEPQESLPRANVAATTYSVKQDIGRVLVDHTATAAVAVTLDTDNVTEGRRIEIIDSGSNAATNNVTIDTEGSALINGAATYTIDVDDGAVSLYCDGTDYIVTGAVGGGGGGVTDHGALTGKDDDDHTQYLLADGSRALTANWNTGGFNITVSRLAATAAQGSAPFLITSTTKSTNLNADLLDDQEGTYYLDSANFTGTNWTDLTDAGETALHIHDHGALNGKGDDDHTQYSLAAGTRAFTGVVGGVTPTADAHLATKGYVDSGDEPAITTVSSSTHTVVLANKLVHVTYTATGTVTITIDSDNAVSGRIFKIIDGGGLAGTNNITINTEGSETINGENSVVINGNYGGVEIYSDGTDYFISSIIGG